jgi:hypothetical protein
MEKPVENCMFKLDVLLVDKGGQRLPNPMITVAIDVVTRTIIGANISTGKLQDSNKISEL